MKKALTVPALITLIVLVCFRVDTCYNKLCPDETRNYTFEVTYTNGATEVLSYSVTSSSCTDHSPYLTKEGAVEMYNSTRNPIVTGVRKLKILNK